MNAVLAQPETHLALARAPLRVNPNGCQGRGRRQVETATNLDLAELSIGDGLLATIAFVRIARR